MKPDPTNMEPGILQRLRDADRALSVDQTLGLKSIQSFKRQLEFLFQWATVVRPSHWGDYARRKKNPHSIRNYFNGFVRVRRVRFSRPVVDEVGPPGTGVNWRR